ncbi:MAG: hypothetical protein BIP78_1404 [Candidatus Bipolaricaulis sibiricus]|uniref:Nucleoside phosphorylase domain-containing protein n=1 Tax=Bipolaricaulis sibiricus TaxID=2501609 RepID=A0A410FW82_BIPS1|nr:MAG: hypothetical protein BIP78_1404 [Candidatus Bipolaricaulis sibiricus]
MILTVAALATELLFVPRPRLRVGVGAGAGQRLRAWLGGHRPDGVLVVGFAGATRAGVAAGSLLVAAEILGDESDRIPLDPALVARAQAALPHAIVEGVATVARPADPAGKARLGVGAAAVDMESLHLARELAGRGIPFLVVRAVLDELWEDVLGSPRMRWAGRAVACARRLGRAAEMLGPVLEGA